eukprot:Nitzschia sp. Nitz4//scaffold179_size51476//25531//29865//NITZ4_006927-RA/size51476-snap-gene-0.97-mRNA-1//-1//CDS//3329539219//8003//frame0
MSETTPVTTNTAADAPATGASNSSQGDAAGTAGTAGTAAATNHGNNQNNNPSKRRNRSRRKKGPAAVQGANPPTGADAAAAADQEGGNSNSNNNGNQNGQRPSRRNRRGKKKPPANTDQPDQPGQSSQQPQKKGKKPQQQKKKQGPRKRYPWRRYIPQGTVDPITLENLVSLEYPPFALVVDAPYDPVPIWPIPQPSNDQRPDPPTTQKTPADVEQLHRQRLAEQWGNRIVQDPNESEQKPAPLDPTQRHYNLFDGRALAYYIVSELQFIDPLNRRDLTRPELVQLDRYLVRHGFTGLNVTDAYDARGVTLSSAGAAATTAQGRAEILQQTARNLLDSMFSVSRVAAAPPPPRTRTTQTPIQQQYAAFQQAEARAMQQFRSQQQHPNPPPGMQHRERPTQSYDAPPGQSGFEIIDDDAHPELRTGNYNYTPYYRNAASAPGVPDFPPLAVNNRAEASFPALAASAPTSQPAATTTTNAVAEKKPGAPSKTLAKITGVVKKSDPEERQRQWEAREAARKKAMIANMSFGADPQAILLAQQQQESWLNSAPPVARSTNANDVSVGQLERNKAFADALGVQPATMRQTINSGWARPTEPPRLDEFGNELTATIYPDELLAQAKENLTLLTKLEKKWTSFLTDDKAASVPLSHMERPIRAMVHHYAEFWHLKTESFDPEPRRYIHCVKTLNTHMPRPLLSDAARRWRGPVAPTILASLPPEKRIEFPQATKAPVLSDADRPKLELAPRTLPLELPPFQPPEKSEDVIVAEKAERRAKREEQEKKRREAEERKQRALEAAFASDDDESYKGGGNDDSDSEWEDAAPDGVRSYVSGPSINGIFVGCQSFSQFPQRNHKENGWPGARTTMGDLNWNQRRKNDFENAKAQCLGKRDKSSAGRIDPHAVDICGIINEREDCYTTSSCSGRCFMYRGSGFKATENFSRFRISHEKIEDPTRFFDLSTISTDPSGGGDPIRSIGQYDYKEQQSPAPQVEHTNNEEQQVEEADKTIWLRFEPFILHVACRSLSSANDLMSAARPAFKNVGLTTWKDSRYLVAIWGDEGLEMPLRSKDGQVFHTDSKWLAELVNERHERNWAKIDRFCQSVREMPAPSGDMDEQQLLPNSAALAQVPKSFDVIGDIAYLHSMPTSDAEGVGIAIMNKNKSIKLVVARQSNLGGTERAPGEDGLTIIAGATRNPLVTTHTEYGIKCVVDLNHTFFSPRMGQERLRICQLVARGEKVLVLFAGVGMEALQIAGRTEASSVVSVELNDVAVRCAHRGHRMLERNKAVKCVGAADRLSIMEGDVMQVLPNQLKNETFDRILAPRPKEGALDGDLGTGDGGAAFLQVIVPHLSDGGECHWYDFVADHEFPECLRTRRLIEQVCELHNLSVDIIHVANAGSVAMRQLRVCVDFKVHLNISKSG